jgi:MinD superfamily P-loop ATPase
MKQITIISGKGGTGKTTLVASFASLARNKVIADCDVDAPDLHLLLKPEITENTISSGRRLQRLTDQNAPGADHVKRHVDTM